MKKLFVLIALCAVPLTACGPADCDPGEEEKWIPCGDKEPPICGHYECAPKDTSGPKDTADNGA